MSNFTLHPITDKIRPVLGEQIRQRWGSDLMVAHGINYYPAEQDGFVAMQAGELAGWITYTFHGADCEITLLDSLRPRLGIGRALIGAVEELALLQGRKRLWLITTNDNLDALRFYQRIGFELVRINRHAVNVARQVKPEIPLVGDYGIPIRDEIELERLIPAEEDTANL